MIAQAFNGEWHVLPAPAVVQNGDSLQTFLDEPQIKRVLELGKQSDIALVGIGVCDENALLARAVITKSEMQQLRSLGAVGGSAAGFMAQRQPVPLGCRRPDHIDFSLRPQADPDQDRHCCRAEQSACNQGALAGGYVNILVTDLITAQALLDQCTASDSCELC